MKNPYNQYHTDLKLAFTLGVYQDKDITCIPKSTLHNWKRRKPEYYKSFLGNNYSKQLVEAMEKLIKAKVVIKTLKAFLIIKNGLILLAKLPKNLKNRIETKKTIVKIIQNTKETIGFNRVLKYFEMSASTFYDWAFQIKFSCEESLEKLCFKRFVNQISIPEIQKLKTLMESVKEYNWPLSSIWGYGRKHKTISFSKSTFYKYTKILFPGYPQKYKKKRTQGFVTSFPNQVWHCDITQFKTRDGNKVNIYILMDNFSKFILNWKVSLSVSSSNCKDMIKETIEIYSISFCKITIPDLFPLINLNLDKNMPYVHLLSDGGPENLGELNTYIREEYPPINKLIAKADITFSNSPIEALNKILKYQFLHLTEVRDINHIERLLSEWFPIYNNQRPNRSGKYILTPYEVHNNVSLDREELREETIQARKERILYNQSVNCGVC